MWGGSIRGDRLQSLIGFNVPSLRAEQIAECLPEALPLQAGRSSIRRNNRLGRHKTKREGGSGPGVGAPESAEGRLHRGTPDSDPPVQGCRHLVSGVG